MYRLLGFALLLLYGISTQVHCQRTPQGLCAKAGAWLHLDISLALRVDAAAPPQPTVSSQQTSPVQHAGAGNWPWYHALGAAADSIYSKDDSSIRVNEPLRWSPPSVAPKHKPAHAY